MIEQQNTQTTMKYHFTQTLNEYRAVSTNAPHVIQTYQPEYEQLLQRNPFSVEAQQAFIDNIIHHDTVKKFNLPLQFVVKVIKQYIHVIEHCDDDRNEGGVSENLMDLYWNLSASLPQANDSFSQRHLAASHRLYDISSLSHHNQNDSDEENLIVLKVWPAFTHVGLAMWEAGYYIAEWILANEELFSGKRVLELGSGVGLSAITLARPFDPSYPVDKLPNAIYMTDYSDIVLRNCVDNMRINRLEIIDLSTQQQQNEDDDEDEEEQCTSHMNRARLVHVGQLDWTKFSDEQLEAIDANVILAADVIYDRSVIEGLVDVTSRLIFNRNQQVVVYFAITKRNADTFEYFKQECLQKRIITEDVTETSKSLSIFPYTGRDQVRMYKLYSVAEL
jgi:predicted nicotinamide N-methyase